MPEEQIPDFSDPSNRPSFQAGGIIHRSFINLNQPPRSGLNRSDYIDYYKIFRDYTMQESGLINARFTWLITLNSLLFAAVGFLLPKELDLFKDHAGRSTIYGVLAFISVICVVAIVVNLLGWFSINAAKDVNNAVQGLFENTRNGAHNVVPRNDPTIDIDIKYYVTADGYAFPALRGGGSEKYLRRSYLAYKLIPVVFVIAWFTIGVLTYEITHKQIVRVSAKANNQAEIINNEAIRK